MGVCVRVGQNILLTLARPLSLYMYAATAIYIIGKVYAISGKLQVI